MPRDGSSTREKIMDAAEALILQSGFAGTSIDRIIDQAGITKGTFFYHFESKAELAHTLVERYAASDLDKLDTNMARAEQLSRDPLQQLLIFVGLFREEAAELAEPYPGCLFASYVYEAGLFDASTLATIARTFETWRGRLSAKIAAAAERHPPRFPISHESLADMLTVVFEGAFIMSMTLKEPALLADQIDHYRNYLELLFSAGEDSEGAA